MAKKFFTPIDLNKNQLQNMVMQLLAADPSSPTEGQMWYNTTSHVLKYRDNGANQTLSSGGGITNGYANISDGTTTAVAIGADTITFNTGNTKLSIAAVNGAAGADTVTWTVNEANIVHNNLSGLTTGDPHTQYGLLAGRAGGQTLKGGTAASESLTLMSTNHATKGTIVLGTSIYDEVNNRLGIGKTPSFPLDITASSGIAIAAGNGRITSVADPTSAQDAATKNYVDVTAQGLQPKPTARLATAAALPANTYANGTSGVGATLTATANGALSVDGVAVAANDVILVKNEATAANNGLYTVTQAGDGTHPYILTRHIDMDQTGEFSGAFIPVGNAGSTLANSLWLANPSGTVTVGTTSIPFTQMNGATDLIAGTGITISGNTISVATTYAGGTSIVSLGTITTGTWNGTTIAVANGGTGQTTAVNARGTSGLGSQTAPANATNVVTTARGIPLKVTAVITHDGAATSFTITHNIGTSDVVVDVWDNNSPRNKIEVDVQVTDANTVTIVFSAAQTNGTVFNATVIG